LIDALDRFDSAVFVFSPDDTTIIRGSDIPSVRDNVIFELGLFAGRLGIENCFIFAPRSFSELQFPTDLVGVTPAFYDDARNDGNLVAALGAACNKIRRQVAPRPQPVTMTPNRPPSLADILVSRPFRLVFNPMTKRSKRIVFADGGRIVEGNNRNEHSWRIVDGKLELLRLDGTLQSRFTFDPGNQLFQHTNDPDTVSIRGQWIAPDDGSAS
jgi:hypothetical protein